MGGWLRRLGCAGVLEGGLTHVSSVLGWGSGGGGGGLGGGERYETLEQVMVKIGAERRRG